MLFEHGVGLLLWNHALKLSTRSFLQARLEDDGVRIVYKLVHCVGRCCHDGHHVTLFQSGEEYHDWILWVPSLTEPLLVEGSPLLG